MSDGGGERIRAFVAAELDASARDAAAGVARTWREAAGDDAVRWTRPEGYHVTLRFLGDVDAATLPELLGELGRAVAPLAPFQVSLGAAHGFPNPRRARALVLDLEPAEPLAALAGAVEGAVSRLGFHPDDRPYRAHLTLGRVRRGAKAPRAEAPAVPPARFAVREAVLFQSELHPSGARYTALGRAALGDSHPS